MRHAAIGSTPSCALRKLITGGVAGQVVSPAKATVM
jgi:hypothetical protein